MQTVQLACKAMASRFELVLQGEDARWLRAAGEEALGEIQRLDAQLSLYRRTSDVSRINAHAAERPVPVEPHLFGLLQTARRLHAQTQGTFDVTVAPLMQCWGFVHGTGRLPDPEALAEARACTGMQLVELDAARRTVAFARPGVRIDLGAIGKGYAVDEAMQLLRDLGVERAFLHGGTSTMHAIGRPYDADAWKVAVEDTSQPDGGEADVLSVVALEDEALSVSAVWGKAFEAEGTTYGHVLDPRAGRPVQGAVLAAVAHASATEADALSTALLVLGHDGIPHVAGAAENVRALVVGPSDEGGRREVRRHKFPALIAVEQGIDP